MRHTRNHGFTLIELMIVVVVIGLLATIAIPNFVAMTRRAKEAGTKANMHTLQVAAEDYAVENGGDYAAIIDATHLADRLPPSFENPFSGLSGQDVSWEDRGVSAAAASPISGIASYADSLTASYNIKGHGKSAAMALVLSSGQ